MNAVLDNLTTGWLMVLIVAGGLALVGRDSLPLRRMPWLAVTLTASAVAGVIAQLVWSGAMDALDDDPARPGWWRVATSVFVQNGGVAGAVWNIVTLAVVAALAEWFWGRPLTLGLFVAGFLLPHRLDVLLGLVGGPVDPRNFAGSSGTTYFLGATLAAPLLLRARTTRERLIAVAVPGAGLALWFLRSNAHGLVSAYGWAIGAVVWAVGHRVLRPDRDLVRPARTTLDRLPGIRARPGSTPSAATDVRRPL